MFNISDRVRKTRQYVKDNAPALITAASTLGLYLLVRDQQRALEASNQMMRDHIDWAIENDRAFSHFPGLGVRVWPPYSESENVPMNATEPVVPIMDQYFGAR